MSREYEFSAHFLLLGAHFGVISSVVVMGCEIKGKPSQKGSVPSAMLH
jgi:hypothetical protein